MYTHTRACRHTNSTHFSKGPLVSPVVMVVVVVLVVVVVVV